MSTYTIHDLFACDTERKLRRFLNNIKPGDTAEFVVLVIARSGRVSNVLINHDGSSDMKVNNTSYKITEKYSANVYFKYLDDKEYYKVEGVIANYDTKICTSTSEKDRYVDTAKLIAELAYYDGYFGPVTLNDDNDTYLLLTNQERKRSVAPHRTIVKEDVPCAPKSDSVDKLELNKYKLLYRLNLSVSSEGDDVGKLIESLKAAFSTVGEQ